MVTIVPAVWEVRSWAAVGGGGVRQRSKEDVTLQGNPCWDRVRGLWEQGIRGRGHPGDELFQTAAFIQLIIPSVWLQQTAIYIVCF